MAISAFAASTAFKLGTSTISSLGNYFISKENDRANLSNLRVQQALNNELTILNSSLVSEDQIREMRGHGLNMQELMRLSVSNISGAKTANPYGINDRSGRAAIRNVSAEGARERFVATLNFGTKLRALDIERLNLVIGNFQRNTNLAKSYTPKANLISTALNITNSSFTAGKDLLDKSIETGINQLTGGKIGKARKFRHPNEAPETGQNTGTR